VISKKKAVIRLRMMAFFAAALFRLTSSADSLVLNDTKGDNSSHRNNDAEWHTPAGWQESTIESTGCGRRERHSCPTITVEGPIPGPIDSFFEVISQTNRI
jgi:hypothetical protein